MGGKMYLVEVLRLGHVLGQSYDSDTAHQDLVQGSYTGRSLELWNLLSQHFQVLLSQPRQQHPEEVMTQGPVGHQTL